MNTPGMNTQIEYTTINNMIDKTNTIIGTIADINSRLEAMAERAFGPRDTEPATDCARISAQGDANITLERLHDVTVQLDRTREILSRLSALV